MNAARRVANVIVLVGAMAPPGLQAAGSDEALCRGDYPVMLMTELECRLYARQVETLRSQGQIRALANLQQQHAEQLRERAAICPCMDLDPEVAFPQQVVLLDPDC